MSLGRRLRTLPRGGWALKSFEEGLEAEEQFLRVLGREDRPARKASRVEDGDHKIDFWVMDRHGKAWIKVQLTIASGLGVLAGKVQDCRDRNVCLVRLDRKRLQLAAGRPNKAAAVKARREIVQAVDAAIADLLRVAPEAAQSDPWLENEWESTLVS